LPKAKWKPSANKKKGDQPPGASPYNHGIGNVRKEPTVAIVANKHRKLQARSYKTTKSKLTPEQQAVYEWMLADLKRSGLTDEDIIVKPYTKEESAALGLWKTAACYTIQYHDEHGKPIDMFRARWQPATSGFEKLIKQKNKYAQPDGTGCEIYLSLRIKWQEILNKELDAEQFVYIVEGEKKAECLCKWGYTAVGVGGVWSFGSKIDNLHDLLQRIAKAGYTLVICYDSDLDTNPFVQLGEDNLAIQLSTHGAMVKAIRIQPGPEGEKRGADDTTKEEFEEYVRQAVHIGIGAKYAELSNKYGCMLDEAKFFNYPTKDRPKIDKWTHTQFYNVVAAQEKITILVPKFSKSEKDGNGEPKITGTDKVEKPAAKPWAESFWRVNYNTTVYKPNEDRVINSCFNIWAGWGCEPLDGDIAPFTAVLEHVVPDKQERTYLLDWLAYPLQHPGVKIPIAVILISYEQGIGKSSLMRAMTKIYGDMNTSWIGEDDLKDKFNSWLPNKQFIVANEINGINGRQHVAKLKNLVSEEKLHVNQKYKSAEQMGNGANFVFMTNDIDAFEIEAKDRRFFVIDSHADKLPKALSDKFNEWLNGTGPSTLFHHLLQRNLEKFNPYEAAPMTAGKLEAIDQSLPQIQRWVRVLATEPESLVIAYDSPIPKALTTHTVEELLKMYGEQHSRYGTGEKAMLRALRDEGYKKVQDSVRMGDGKKYRLWIAPRHLSGLENATHGKHRELFERERKDIPIYNKKFDKPKNAAGRESKVIPMQPTGSR
jgi:hypothetical protein